MTNISHTINQNPFQSLVANYLQRKCDLEIHKQTVNHLIKMLYKTFTIVTILFFCRLNTAFNLLEQQPSNYFPVKLNQNSVKLKCQFDSQVKFCEWRRGKDDKQCNWSNKWRVIFIIICFRFYQYWNGVKSWLLNANQQFTRQCRT